jgi:hypothetical protein
MLGPEVIENGVTFVVCRQDHRSRVRCGSPFGFVYLNKTGSTLHVLDKTLFLWRCCPQNIKGRSRSTDINTVTLL